MRIVCDNGTAGGVKVLDASGKMIEWGGSGLSRVVIDPIEPDGIIRATLTIEFVDLG
jgi:hypothetical protein